MGFFDFLKQPDINAGLADYRAAAGAVLLDVRTEQEYRDGHIPGSRNLPLQELDRIGSVVDGTSVPLFVYCYSGARSRQAVAALRSLGYANVRNIGGIADYSGKTER